MSFLNETEGIIVAMDYTLTYAQRTCEYEVPLKAVYLE